MLSKDQLLLLDVLKNINDSNIQKDYLEKILKSLKDKEENKILPSTSKKTYDLTNILDKKTKNVTIQNLQKDIKEIKLEIKELKEKQNNDAIILQNINNEKQNIEKISEDFLFVLKEIISRKYLLKIKIIFSENFKINTMALFDTGADLNCIKSDVVPQKFQQKTQEKLSAANSKLNVNSKTEASILNDSIIIKTAFILVNNIYHTVILGTSFISLITPFKVKK